jgi:hypothetical protein
MDPPAGSMTTAPPSPGSLPSNPYPGRLLPQQGGQDQRTWRAPGDLRPAAQLERNGLSGRLTYNPATLLLRACLRTHTVPTAPPAGRGNQRTWRAPTAECKGWCGGKSDTRSRRGSVQVAGFGGRGPRASKLGGNGQKEPTREECNSTERSDCAEPSRTRQRQSVQAAAKEHRSGDEEPACPLRQRSGPPCHSPSH